MRFAPFRCCCRLLSYLLLDCELTAIEAALGANAVVEYC